MQWNSTSFLDIFLYILSSVLVLPFHLLLYAFTICGLKPGQTGGGKNPCLSFVYELGLHFTYPVNRFLGEFKSYVFFLILIFVASYYDLEYRYDLLTDTNNTDTTPTHQAGDYKVGVELAEFPINWADIPVLIMAIGFLSRSLWTIVKSILDRWVLNKRYDMTVKFWTYTHFFASLCIALSVLIKVGANHYFADRISDLEPYEKNYHNNLLQIIFCFLGLGTFMIIVRIFFFFSLHRHLGPIALIIKRVTKVCNAWHKWQRKNIFVLGHPHNVPWISVCDTWLRSWYILHNETYTKSKRV